MYLATLTCSFLFARLALTQTGVIDPISEDCGPSVVCVNHYANVLPYVFEPKGPKGVSTPSMSHRWN